MAFPPLLSGPPLFRHGVCKWWRPHVPDSAVPKIRRASFPVLCCRGYVSPHVPPPAWSHLQVPLLSSSLPQKRKNKEFSGCLDWLGSRPTGLLATRFRLVVCSNLLTEGFLGGCLSLWMLIFEWPQEIWPTVCASFDWKLKHNILKARRRVTLGWPSFLSAPPPTLFLEHQGILFTFSFCAMNFLPFPTSCHFLSLFGLVVSSR